jgi:hypothetical protein
MVGLTKLNPVIEHVCLGQSGQYVNITRAVVEREWCHGAYKNGDIKDK